MPRSRTDPEKIAGLQADGDAARTVKPAAGTRASVSSAALRAGGIHRRQTRTTDLMHGASNRLLAAMLDGRADQPTADEVGGTHLRGSMDQPLIQLAGAAVRRETVRAVTN